MKKNFKIVEGKFRSKFIEWIKTENFEIPFFRAFKEINAIPFISNEKQKGKILLACVFPENAPEGWKVKIEGNYIYLIEDKK